MSRIPRSLEQLGRDLELISGISQLNLTSVFAALRDSNERIESPESLSVIVSEFVELDVAEALVQQLLRLENAVRRTGLSVAELIEVQIQQVNKYYGDTPDVQASLCSGLMMLAELANLPAIWRAAKAIELSYDSDNLLQRTRILTDVRPLFSEDAQSIDGAVVAHTLRLRFDSAGIDHELSLALDCFQQVVEQFPGGLAEEILHIHHQPLLRV